MSDVIKLVAAEPTKEWAQYEVLSLAVRGFQTQANGEKAIEVLEEEGWVLKYDMFDGGSDSMGGLIETEIRDRNADWWGMDLDEIRDAIAAAIDDPTIKIVVQWQGYSQRLSGEL